MTITELNALIDHHPDTGCDLAPSCLSCPFVRCRYDGPNVVSQHRASLVEQLRDTGLTPAEIAARVGLTPRSVFRILSEARHAPQEDAP